MHELDQVNRSQLDPSTSSHKELFNFKIEEQQSHTILEERITNVIKEELVRRIRKFQTLR